MLWPPPPLTDKFVAFHLVEASLKQSKPQLSDYNMWLHSLSMHLPVLFLCVCLCVRACVCFRWQRVHFIPNAPVSLLSRTRSEQVLVTKLKQHKTKQNGRVCPAWTCTGTEVTHRQMDWQQKEEMREERWVHYLDHISFLNRVSPCAACERAWWREGGWIEVLSGRGKVTAFC